MISYSIVISTYNQKYTLKLALESLSRQIKTPKIFELIIADDASTDGIDEFIKKLRFPIFLKYIRSDENLGRSKNRNRGIEKAMGKQVILFDGDMVPEDGFIEAYMRAWDEFPSGVILGSWRAPDNTNNSRWQKYQLSRGRLGMSRGQNVPGKYFTSGNFSIANNILSKMSGFDTSFEGWGGEDTDFGFRLERNGVPMHFMPEASCLHYHNKAISETISEYERYGKYGYRALMNKYPETVMFEKGWLLGLPDSTKGVYRKIISIILYPLRLSPSLWILRKLAAINDGALFSDSLFDWLLYGHLARGFRRR
jgi:glycosyltransferase involved in cell wall biosynthesis